MDTDPFTLWAPPHGRSARDKLAYDEAFGPFYRIEQLILSTVPENNAPKPILAKENIEFVRLSSVSSCFVSGRNDVHRSRSMVLGYLAPDCDPFVTCAPLHVLCCLMVHSRNDTPQNVSGQQAG